MIINLVAAQNRDLLTVTDSRWGHDPYGTNPKAALAAARPGDIVYFPTGTYTNPPGVGAGYTVVSDNVTVYAGPGVTINTSVWGQCGIDCFNRSGVIVGGGLTIAYTGVRGDHTGTAYRGSSPYVNGCGVYINRDRCKVDGLHTIGMPVGVFLSSYNGTSSTDRTGVGNAVQNLETETFDFGILWVGQEALDIDGVYGHDDVDDSSGVNQTHVYYCSGANTLPTTNLNISNIRARNVLHGQPFQLRYARGGTVVGQSAIACTGLMNLAGCEDMEISAVAGSGILGNVGQGALTVVGTAESVYCSRVSISDLYIAHATDVDERMVRVAGDDIDISNAVLIVKRPAVPVGGNYAYITSGTKQRHRNITIKSRGSGHVAAFLAGVNGFTNDSLHFEDFVLESVTSIVDIQNGATGVVAKYNPAQQSILAGTVYIGPLSGTATFWISRAEYEKRRPLASGSTTGTPVPYLETRTYFDVTDNSNITIANNGGATAPLGTIMDIVIANNSGGAMGTVTWNAAYTLLTPFTVPDNGASVSRRFRWSGTKWVEVIGPATITQVVTATGTVTVPTGCKSFQWRLVGSTSGAGSGARGVSGSALAGGGPSGGAGFSMGSIAATGSFVPGTTLTVTLGAAGTGGAAPTTDNTAGAAGTAAATCTFGIGTAGSLLATVLAGTAGGGGGLAAAGTAGSAGLGMMSGTAGTASSAAGTFITGSGNSVGGGAPGGPGGGILAGAPAAQNGGNGGSNVGYSIGMARLGGIVGGAGPTTESAPFTIPGAGGGGGAASITGAAQDGANAGLGGGAGGGGAALNTFLPGKGGDGKIGQLEVTWEF